MYSYTKQGYPIHTSLNANEFSLFYIVKLSDDINIHQRGHLEYHRLTELRSIISMYGPCSTGPFGGQLHFPCKSGKSTINEHLFYFYFLLNIHPTKETVYSDPIQEEDLTPSITLRGL